MFSRLKNIIDKIKELSNLVDTYKKDTVIQSLPSLTFVNRAKKLIDKNKLKEAEELLLEALELPQKDSLVYKYLGVVYEKMQKHDLAVENYQISADLSPLDKTIWQRLGFSLISVCKYEQAIKSFENADKVQAGNSETYTGWGMALMRLKKYDLAKEQFLKATESNKYNFVAMFLCAVADIKLENYDMAEQKLSFLVKVAPNESSTFEYARLKAIKDDYENAIYYAKKSLEYNPKMISAYIILGQVYGYMSDKENSLKYFSLAEENGLKISELYLEWGKTLKKFDEYDDAISKLLKAYEDDPENNEVISNLGFCYAVKKDFENALSMLRKILEKDPENKLVKQAFGILNLETGNIETAISCLRSDVEDAVNCYYLAKCYEKQNNDTKVREFYESSLSKISTNINVYSDYIKYLMSKDDYAEAQRKLRKVLKIDSENIELLNLMFYSSYILVKDNICEYNIKEALSIAEKIESIGTFKYPEQKQELLKLLPERE